MTSVVGAAVAAMALVACSGNESAPEEPQQTVTPPTTAPNPEGALRDAAEQLDRQATAGNAEAAWEFYSQRCKGIIGDVDTYKMILDAFYKGRTPNYTDWVVRVNGSSGQVVTVDSDPSAPPSAMQPRTWTYIDGRWQFDNC